MTYSHRETEKMANLMLKSDVSNDLKQNADQIGSVAKVRVLIAKLKSTLPPVDVE